MNQLTTSLWGDESFSALIAKKNIVDIIHIAGKDTAPPLYYLLLHFWTYLFGSSEIALRSLSLTFFSLLGVIIYCFSKEIFGKKIAILSSAMVLANPFLFLYSFEARTYMLLSLLATASIWFFMTKRWIPYIIATTAAVYTHHFAIWIVLVEIVSYLSTTITKQTISNPKYFLMYVKQQSKSMFVRSILISILLYSPWIPTLYAQMMRVTSDFWISKPSITDFFSIYKTFFVGNAETSIAQATLWGSILLLCLSGYRNKQGHMLYLWLFLPPVITFLLSQVGKPVFFDRYLIECTPAISILVSSAILENSKPDVVITSISNIKKIIKNFYIKPIIITMIFVGLIIINSNTFTHPDKQPFRDLSQFIKKTYGKNVTVINYYTNHLHYFELKYYHISTKIYSPSPLPFWVGTALIDPKDILTKIPNGNQLLIMASGDIQQIKIKGYTQQAAVKYNELYLFTYIKMNTSMENK